MNYLPINVLRSIGFTILILTISCRDKERTQDLSQNREHSILEKVAQAHGFDHWKKVKKIQFTFNVDRDTLHFERYWQWKPGSAEIISISDKDTIHYKKTAVDSSLVKVDAAFINDKYWLLAPFNLLWDQQNFKHSHSPESIAPFSNKSMQKLTIVYSEKGGYTPGDAYDFYFEDDYLIKEWVFRKGNQEDPTLITSWESYRNFNGLNLATEFRRTDPNILLSFSDIVVE